MEPAAATSPPAEVTDAVCDWAFRQSSPSSHLVVGVVMLAGLIWLIVMVWSGWEPRLYNVTQNQSLDNPTTHYITYLVLFLRNVNSGDSNQHHLKNSASVSCFVLCILLSPAEKY